MCWLLSCVLLLAAPWTGACQASLSRKLSTQVISGLLQSLLACMSLQAVLSGAAVSLLETATLDLSSYKPADWALLLKRMSVFCAVNYKLGLLCSTFYNRCRQVKQMQAGGRYSFFILDLNYHTLWGGQFIVFKKKKGLLAFDSGQKSVTGLGWAASHDWKKIRLSYWAGNFKTIGPVLY